MFSIAGIIVGALGLVIRQLRNAPVGYEAEDGFQCEPHWHHRAGDFRYLL
jgi:hypothetical protein